MKIRISLVALFCLLEFVLLITTARAQKGADKNMLALAAKIKHDIDILASDSLEGRGAGMHGEALAADYIAGRFRELGLQPYKSEQFLHDFLIKEGRKVGSFAYFKLNEQNLVIGKDVVQLPYGHGDRILGSALPFVDETDNIWMVSMKAAKAETSANPYQALYDKAKDCIQHGATAILFFNDAEASKDLNLNHPPKLDALSVPVVFIHHKAYVNFIKPFMHKDWIDIDARFGYEDANLSAHNVVAFLPKENATATLLLTADYDFLGQKEKHYPGANENASAVAALLNLAELIKNTELHQYNVLFMAFSGSQYNHQGRVALLNDLTISAGHISGIIDLGSLGRLNTSRELFLNGLGTADSWKALPDKCNKGFVLKTDSSGYGWGGYSLFYKKRLPLIHLSTGYNRDMYKSSDLPDKINANAEAELLTFVQRFLIEADKMLPPAFSETRNPAESFQKVKNDLGIIPDIDFNGEGLKILAVLPAKPAEKAGLEFEDIITRISDYPITDFEDYQGAMNRIEKGREIAITVLRDKKELKFFASLSY